jgi:hypothetical protein
VVRFRPWAPYTKKPRIAGLFCIWSLVAGRESQSGSTNCEAVSKERASAKPAGDKQPKGCLDYSAPTPVPVNLLELLYFYPAPFSDK